MRPWRSPTVAAHRLVHPTYEMAENDILDGPSRPATKWRFEMLSEHCDADASTLRDARSRVWSAKPS